MSSIPPPRHRVKIQNSLLLFGQSCFLCNRVDNQKRNIPKQKGPNLSDLNFRHPCHIFNAQKRRSLGTPFPSTVFLYACLTLCRIPYLCLLLWLSSWLSNPLLPGRLLEMPPPPRGFPAPSTASTRLAPCDILLELVLRILKPLHRLIMTLHFSPTAWPSFLLLCGAQHSAWLRA